MMCVSELSFGKIYHVKHLVHKQAISISVRILPRATDSQDVRDSRDRLPPALPESITCGHGAGKGKVWSVRGLGRTS